MRCDAIMLDVFHARVHYLRSMLITYCRFEFYAAR